MPIIESVRSLPCLLALLLSACGPAPPPAAKSAGDPTQEAWYGQAVRDLARMSRDAETQLKNGKPDKAAELITAGEPIVNRVISVPQPTLAAMEAASDLDQLYGQMLLSNGNYGWARLMFQKNHARWKNWQPQTPETARRLQLSNDAIAECDRKMGQ